MSATSRPSERLIAACVHVTDLRPDVDPLTGEVRTDRLAVGLSPSDEAAVEHALRIGEAWSGRVAVVAVGPRSIDAALRELTALGLAAVRVPDGHPEEQVAGEPSTAEVLAADEQLLARAAAAAIGALGVPDLVVCGDRSTDRGTGAFPAFLAHELGASQALGLVALAPRDDGTALLAERRLDAGWREQLAVPLPAVCSVEAAGVRLRRATLLGALAAAERAVAVDEAAGRVLRAARERSKRLRAGTTQVFEPRTRVVPAPVGADPHRRVLALTGALAPHDPPTIVGPVDAAEAAEVLLEYLVRHGYLADPAAIGPDATAPGERA